MSVSLISAEAASSSSPERPIASHRFLHTDGLLTLPTVNSQGVHSSGSVLAGFCLGIEAAHFAKRQIEAVICKLRKRRLDGNVHDRSFDGGCYRQRQCQLHSPGL